MLRFARNDGDFRNDGILNEIASFALLPRNDAGNSRIPYRDPRVKPEDDIVDEIVVNFRISKDKTRIPYRDPQSSWGMTKTREF